ncbi:MAG: DUF4291 family protein [Hassallia sp.]
MELVTEAYLTQVSRLPKIGRHIIAQYDDHSIVVYQAYRQAIAHLATTHNYFCGEFKLDPMNWIKTNWIVKIEDISEFVHQERQNIKSDCVALITPRETVYSVIDTEIQQKLGLSAFTE